MDHEFISNPSLGRSAFWSQPYQSRVPGSRGRDESEQFPLIAGRQFAIGAFATGIYSHRWVLDLLFIVNHQPSRRNGEKVRAVMFVSRTGTRGPPALPRGRCHSKHGYEIINSSGTKSRLRVCRKTGRSPRQMVFSRCAQHELHFFFVVPDHQADKILLLANTFCPRNSSTTCMLLDFRVLCPN